MEYQEKYLIYLNKLIKCDEFEDSFLREGITIYEVIRVIDGKCLFFNDHFERFCKSLDLSNISAFHTYNDIKHSLYKLIKTNNVRRGNIKYLIHKNNDTLSYLAYFTPHSYPTQNQYYEGVSSGIYNAERDMPNAKVWKPELRKTINKLQQNSSHYEILYSNKNGFLTEGSKSSVFLIKNEEVFTAPSNLILEGVTRKHILLLCKTLNIKVILSAVSINDLSLLDAAFITGTSPKVLALKSIEKHNMDVNNTVLRQIMTTYDKLIFKNITMEKNI